MNGKIPIITADEAAAHINDGDAVGFSGFTPAGAAKVVPSAIARRARAEHEAGRRFQIGVLTGASTGSLLDGVLAKADAVAWRTPYQSDKTMRRSINEGKVRFFDMHLSALPQQVRYGFLGPVKVAVVEASEVTEEGEIILTSSVGASNTFCHLADKIIVELNRKYPPELRGLHDIYEPLDPPHRREIPIYTPSDRIGSPGIKVDPAKIVGIVETDILDETTIFTPLTEVTKAIGKNVADFLAGELNAGRLPKEFLPIQSGVGNVANAVLGALGDHPEIPAFSMYTEVVQDSVIALMRRGKVRFASTTALTLRTELIETIYNHLPFFKKRLLLRPQEITNNPEVVRRLGIISINTALEVDLFGNVNSTHVMGRSLMNGIGGSGDFTRNASLSIFVCPSTAKKGVISAIVPLVSHMDHSEHSVQVIVTENGVADLRGKSPAERAWLIADRCADRDFRNELLGYFYHIREGHTPQTLAAAYAMHQQFLKTGTMKNVIWDDFFGVT